MTEALAILAAIVLAFFFGGRRQKAKAEMDKRNQAIATKQRIEDAKTELPSNPDDARQRLRDRAGR